jgi:hypothetical protein
MGDLSTGKNPAAHLLLLVHSKLAMPQKLVYFGPVTPQKIEKAITKSVWIIRSPSKNGFDIATPVTQWPEYNVSGTKMLYAGR